MREINGRTVVIPSDQLHNVDELHLMGCIISRVQRDYLLVSFHEENEQRVFDCLSSSCDRYRLRVEPG